MTEQIDGATTDLSLTMQQLTDDVQRLETAIHRLSESLQKRNLQMSPDVENTLHSLRQRVEQAHKQSEEVVEQSTRLQELVHASALITTSLELEQVLQEVMDSVISMTGAERAYLMLRDGDDLTIRAARNWETRAEEDAIFSSSVIREAFAKAEPILTLNAQSDTRFQSRRSVIGYALRSILCIPLMLERRVVGVLYLDNRIKSGVFNKNSVQLLSAFGSQAAIAIEKARLHEEDVQRQRLEKELSVAREIKFSLLPKSCPTVAGWDFAATYQPARRVGGDFYDFFDLAADSARLGIVIADVADKGVPAALFMAMSRTMIRTTALRGSAPSVALRRANDLILKDSNQSDIFLSAFYAALDTHSGQLTYTNGGHNPPFWYKASSGTLQKLTGRGIVLGLFEGIELEDCTIALEPGDMIVFYTDGVTEAMNVDGQEFGEDRLSAAILKNTQADAQIVMNAITDAIAAFTADAPQSDDVTIVVLKRTP